MLERGVGVSLYKMALLHFQIISNTSDMNKGIEIEKLMQIGICRLGFSTFHMRKSSKRLEEKHYVFPCFLEFMLM